MTDQKETLWTRYGREVTVIKSWGKRRYLVAMGTGMAWGILFRVNGDCEQDAIDFIVDSDKLPAGCFADTETTEAYWNESDPDHIYAQDTFFPAGNASELVYSDSQIIEDRSNPRYDCGY